MALAVAAVMAAALLLALSEKGNAIVGGLIL